MRKLKLEELNRKTVEEYKESEKIPLTVILDDIRSGVNVGSFFRSADAFLIQKLILAGITPTPPHREITRTAIGATSSVDWEYAENIVEVVKTLAEEGKEIIIIEQTDDSVPLGRWSIDSDKEYAVVFGNEVNGVNQDILPFAKKAIEIEQFGTKHSLNVSVCAGIVFWYFSQQFRK